VFSKFFVKTKQLLNGFSSLLSLLRAGKVLLSVVDVIVIVNIKQAIYVLKVACFS